MTQSLHGWTGKILKINLTNKDITILNTPNYANLFIGGRGIATGIYWEHVPPDIKAFDSDNCLVFMTGPLAATGVQGASRMVIVAKSPMTMPEGFCYGNIGGSFGPFLKKAGYDGIMVTGKAPSPCYLFIQDQHIEILDASEMWGQGVYQVEKILKHKHGSKIKFITTGMAGEKMCRSATIGSDRESSCTGGFGAVMGSKNFKAMAVIGSGKPSVAHPKTVTALNRHIAQLNIDKMEYIKIVFPEFFKSETGKRSKSKCFQCGLPCLRGRFHVNKEDVTRKCQASVFYLPWVEKKINEPIETTFSATALCNDNSICTMEMDNIIRWLDACYKAGDITEAEADLPLSEIGNKRFIQMLVNKIIRRDGLGDILAEGLVRAKEFLTPKQQKHFSEYISDVGHTDLSGREIIVTSLLYAFEPREPISMINEFSFTLGYYQIQKHFPNKSPMTYEVFKNVAKTFWGHRKAWDLTTYEGKAEAAVEIQNRTYANESLVLCSTIYPIMFSSTTNDNVGDPNIESRLFSAVTGLKTDKTKLHQYGERIFNLQRAILLREKKQTKLDDYPAEFNFSIPVSWSEINPSLTVPGANNTEQSIKGNILDKRKYETMLHQFYRLRGWNTETGIQKKETLSKLNLHQLFLSSH